MIEINKSLHGAKGKIKAVYLGTTPVVMYLGNQLLYDVDLDGEYVLMDIEDGDTVDSTIEAPIKSAILKGNTLVNLYQSKTVTFVDEEKFNVNKDKLIENNKYTLFYEVKENNNNELIYVDHMKSNKNVNNSYYIESSIGSHKELLTFKKQTNYETNFNWWVWKNGSGQTISIDNIILLEGDYTNVDIPYFTGMQSVKMPVLTTTNCLNLFTKDNTVDDGWPDVFGDFVEAKKNDKFSFNEKYGAGSWTSLAIYNVNKEMIYYKYEDSSLIPKTIVLPDDDRIAYVRPRVAHGQIDTIMFNRGEVIPYEEYKVNKSNILTVNEDVELRGIGEVQDTLNCLTGELTQRVKEVILNGSESWMAQPDTNWNTDTHISFSFIANDMSTNMWAGGKTNCISDKFKTITLDSESYKTSDEFIGSDGTNTVYFNIKISRSRLNGDETVNGLKQWLSQNPITLQYQLKTPVVKTVDLTIVDQDNKTISTLNTFNDTTHFTVQGEKGKLQPVVSMEIACNPSQAISELSNKTEQLQQEQQELTEQVEQQEQDTNNLQTATTDLEEV